MNWNVANSDRLRIKEDAIIKKNAVWYKLIKPVVEELQDIPYAVIKGEPLSLLAYGDLGYRDSGDIDLLVSRDHLPQVTEILNKYHFENIVFDEQGNPRPLTRKEKIMFINSHQMAPFYYVKDRDVDLNIDVNVDVFWGEYTGKRIELAEILSDTISIDMYGTTIKSLSVMPAFLEVCLHHYKEMNSIYCFKLKNAFATYMYQDIYCFYKRHMEKSINELVAYSDKYNLNKYIYYLFYYTQQVFKDDALAEHMDLFKSPEAVKDLNFYGLTMHEKREWRIDFFTRLDHPDLFSLIQPDLTEEDIEKINTVTSIL